MKARGILALGGLILWLNGAATAQEPTLAPTPSDGPESALYDVPILPETFSERVWEIYAIGQERGNHPNVFAKAGDSNSDSPQFLNLIDRGHYDLGNYPELQATVDFFAGSFDRENQSTNSGFNFFALLDPFLASPHLCTADENPLTCEFRISQPSVVFVMHGWNDLDDIGEITFEAKLREIVETSMEYGVIPVLNTYSPRWDNRAWEKSITYNLIVVEIAQEYEIPLINLWLAAQSLPDGGIGADTIHFTSSGQTVIFNGQETQFGHSLRNLLTLMMLDQLRMALPIAE